MLFDKWFKSSQAVDTSKFGRNALCHCGSGKKYKKCHWVRDQEAEAQRILSDKWTKANREQAVEFQEELERSPASAAQEFDLGVRASAQIGLTRLKNWFKS